MKSFFKNERVLIINNLWALGIHAVVAALGMIGMIVAGVLFSSFTAGGIGAFVPVFGYVILGYFLLTPRAKGNFLSVVGLAVLLVTIFGYAFFTDFLMSTSDSSMLMAFNFPALFLAQAIFLVTVPATGLASAELNDNVASAIMLFTSAFIPSLLMYLGLRLKMWLEAKIARTDLELSDE